VGRAAGAARFLLIHLPPEDTIMQDRDNYQMHTHRITQHYAQANATQKPRVPTWIKVAAIVACLGLAGGVTEARADAWTGPDKTKHLVAGLIIAAPVSMLADSWRAGAAAGCAVGVAKELHDMRSPGHTPSYKDAVVTCLGAAIGAKIGVIVAPVPGGVWVGKSWGF
jgi:VanZ family protein